MEFNSHVYIHIRPDTNSVFYVGRGIKKRAYYRYGRNDYWNKVVKKNNGNFIVDIVAEHLDIDESRELEIYLIKFYGRANLCNMTDGGDTTIGFRLTPEQKEKCRNIQLKRMQDPEIRRRAWISNIGKKYPNRNKDFIPKMSKDRMGSGNPMFGKKTSEKTKKLLSEAMSGEKNYLSKWLLNTETGIYYPCLREAADTIGIDKRTLWQNIIKNKKNTTAFIYA